MFLKSVVLINTTLSGKLKKLAQTPKVSYWSIRHFWENPKHSNIDIPKVSYWSIRHFWETYHIVLSDTFGKYIYIYQKGIFSYICTSYYNVNAMTLKLLHWKIRTSSLELKNNPKLGLRPRVGLFFNSRESVRIFQCNNFKVIALSQYDTFGKTQETSSNTKSVVLINTTLLGKSQTF